jgi:dTDP-4-dehydrorhamnose reductase
MNILGTGLSGLVGSRIVKILTHDFSFEDMSLATGIDITDFKSVKKKLEKSSAAWIFHFAALTDVDAGEKENGNKTGNYWKVNVEATDYIVKCASEQGKRILYLSTDYVFDGQKDSYHENDIPNPKGWYATTKYEGEKKVAQFRNNLIIRIANPYRSNPIGKTDFVHKIVERLWNKQQIYAPKDQIFVPTFIDDIAKALRILVIHNAKGIFHVVGDSPISPYNAALEIAHTYALSPNNIHPTSFNDYFVSRAPRPMKAVLIHDKITKFGISMNSFHSGLKEVRKQEIKEEII